MDFIRSCFIAFATLFAGYGQTVEDAGRFWDASNYDTNVTSTLVVIQEISFWGRYVR